MSETFLTRARRLVASGADELLTAAERRSADALRREALRDMDQAIAEATAQHARADAIVARARVRIAELEGEAAARADDARYALERDRQDLARAAISRQLDAEAAVAEQHERIAYAQAEAEALSTARVALAARRAAMADGVPMAGADAGPPIDPRIARRADDAEAALARAAAASAGDSPVPGVATLRREDEIAARLAALSTAKAPRARRPRG